MLNSGHIGVSAWLPQALTFADGRNSSHKLLFYSGMVVLGQDLTAISCLRPATAKAMGDDNPYALAGTGANHFHFDSPVLCATLARGVRCHWLLLALAFGEYATVRNALACKVALHG